MSTQNKNTFRTTQSHYDPQKALLVNKLKNCAHSLEDISNLQRNIERLAQCSVEFSKHHSTKFFDDEEKCLAPCKINRNSTERISFQYTCPLRVCPIINEKILIPPLSHNRSKEGSMKQALNDETDGQISRIDSIVEQGANALTSAQDYIAVTHLETPVILSQVPSKISLPKGSPFQNEWTQNDAEQHVKSPLDASSETKLSDEHKWDPCPLPSSITLIPRPSVCSNRSQPQEVITVIRDPVDDESSRSSSVDQKPALTKRRVSNVRPRRSSRKTKSRERRWQLKASSNHSSSSAESSSTSSDSTSESNSYRKPSRKLHKKRSVRALLERYEKLTRELQQTSRSINRLCYNQMHLKDHRRTAKPIRLSDAEEDAGGPARRRPDSTIARRYLDSIQSGRRSSGSEEVTTFGPFGADGQKGDQGEYSMNKLRSIFDSKVLHPNILTTAEDHTRPHPHPPTLQSKGSHSSQSPKAFSAIPPMFPTVAVAPSNQNIPWTPDSSAQLLQVPLVPAAFTTVSSSQTGATERTRSQLRKRRSSSKHRKRSVSPEEQQRAGKQRLRAKRFQSMDCHEAQHDGVASCQHFQTACHCAFTPHCCGSFSHPPAPPHDPRHHYVTPVVPQWTPADCVPTFPQAPLIGQQTPHTHPHVPLNSPNTRLQYPATQLLPTRSASQEHGPIAPMQFANLRQPMYRPSAVVPDGRPPIYKPRMPSYTRPLPSVYQNDRIGLLNTQQRTPNTGDFVPASSLRAVRPAYMRSVSELAAGFQGHSIKRSPLAKPIVSQGVYDSPMETVACKESTRTPINALPQTPIRSAPLGDQQPTPGSELGPELKPNLLDAFPSHPPVDGGTDHPMPLNNNQTTVQPSPPIQRRSPSPKPVRSVIAMRANLTAEPSTPEDWKRVEQRYDRLQQEKSALEGKITRRAPYMAPLTMQEEQKLRESLQRVEKEMSALRLLMHRRFAENRRLRAKPL